MRIIFLLFALTSVNSVHGETLVDALNAFFGPAAGPLVAGAQGGFNTSFGLAAPANSLIYEFDVETGLPTSKRGSLGPIYTPRAANLGKGRANFDADDFGARDHDITNPDFGEVENAVQHATLLFGNHAGVFAVLDNRANLVFGDQGLVFFALQEMGQQVRSASHQPGHRPQQPHEEADRVQDAERYLFRIFRSVGFRTDFGEDQHERRQYDDCQQFAALTEKIDKECFDSLTLGY